MKKSKLKEKIRLLELANKELNVDVRNVINGKNVVMTTMKYKVIDTMIEEQTKLLWLGAPAHTMKFGEH